MTGAPTQIIANNRRYLVLDDVETICWALITGSVADEVVGGPFRRSFTVTADRPGMASRTIDGGLFALSGYPEQVFPALATTPYTVNLSVEAAGYAPAALVVNVPAGSALPVPAPVIPLRPLPVRLQGRVVDDHTRAPIAGATVLLHSAAPPPHLAGLRWLLHFPHPAGTAVQEQSFTPAAAAKQLTAPASAGSPTVTLSDRAGLAAGGVLRLGPPPQVEYAVIASLAPTPPNPLLPGDVTLTAPLSRSFAALTAVQPVTPGAAGVTRHLTADAGAGEGVLLLDGPLTGDTIAVPDAIPARLEYGALGAISDGQGYYALNSVGRIRNIVLVVSAPAHTTRTVPWIIDYDQPVTIIDIRLSP